MPVPTDATLRVPEGFTVTVYAKGLRQPRWMTLTPEGDVLVVESRANRLLRLRVRVVENKGGSSLASVTTSPAASSRGSG